MSRIVFSAANDFEARLVCDLLRAHDIPHRTSGSSLIALKGAMPLPEATVTVEVLRAEDVERAHALLAEVPRADTESGAWICMGCHEESPGSFDLCWKCGAGRGVSAFVPAASPYRGDQPVSRPEAPAQPVEPPRAAEARSDVFRVLLLGCLPVALLGIWFDRNADVVGARTLVGVAGIHNLAAAVVLLPGLWSFRSRAVAQRKPWRGGQHWALDALGALLLGALLMVAKREGYHLVRSLRDFTPHGSRLPTSPASAGEWLLLCIGAALSAAAGALLFYGILLARLRDLFGPGPLASVPAVLLGAAIVTLTWAPAASWPWLGGLFAAQLLLCAVFVVFGRVWPLAVASFAGYLLEWLVVA
ncbi:MAG TPA: DUF2007 domain-containing protein [Polyangia bacterium]